MPLQKLQFKPGIVRDTTALAAEGGWYAGNNVRFRMGFPEKIGGWQRTSADVYAGICRSLCSWSTTAYYKYTGVGTHVKYYVESGGAYNDITPIRDTAVIAANAFTTTNGSNIVTVNDVAHGAFAGDYVTISAVGSTIGGVTIGALTGNFAIDSITTDTYTITVSETASADATGSSGTFEYELHIGATTNAAAVGWGAGAVSSGTWGATTGTAGLRLWTGVPYGELLVYGQSGGPLYVFTPDPANTDFDRGVLLSTFPGASAVPGYCNYAYFSPAAPILVLLGTQTFAGSTLDPMTVRWSGAANIVDWTPSATNQTGEYRLQNGSFIMGSASIRQDRLILTDTAVYLQQYVGLPAVFSHTEQADNHSIMGPNAIVSVNGAVFWMGRDKFYAYTGQVQSLPCPMLREVFGDINLVEWAQAFAGTNEGFNEIWFFYCSAASETPDRYVIFNYKDSVWSYGTMTRTAWLDTPVRDGPLAATSSSNLVVHEVGIDDLSGASTQAIESYVQSADFDIGDGQSYAFINKMLPDVNFNGSTAASPEVTLTLAGRRDPGSAPMSSPAQGVVQTSSAPLSQWTPEVYVRIRGRQMNFRLDSTAVGVQWQMGTPRINVRPDGRTS